MTRTQSWLKQHRITAFWHGFGISNGLLIEKSKVKPFEFKKGLQTGYIQIPAEVMQDILKEYVQWLRKYEKSWNTDMYDDSPTEQEEYAKDKKVHSSRLLIWEMIKLLQE